MTQRFRTLIRHADGFLVCDAVSDFEFESTLEFTEQPIDDGSTISDHAVRKPQRLSLTLVQTQTPSRVIDGFSRQSQPLTVQSVTYGKQKVDLKIQPKKGVQFNAAAAISAGVGALKKAVSGAPSIEGLKVLPKAPKSLSVTVLKADADVDRIHEFFEQLLKLQTAVAPLTISFKGRDYSNFMLESVRKQDKPGQLGKSSFPVTFKQIRTVATKQVSLPAVPKAKAKKERGVQYGPPPPPVTEEQTRASITGAILTMAGL